MALLMHMADGLISLLQKKPGSDVMEALGFAKNFMVFLPHNASSPFYVS